jgi:acyl carrier protein phosphodiesterase
MFFCKLIVVNYLAHAYLSFDDHEVLTGNMISDFVKGKKKYDYPSRILGGINLHRAIDEFTDDHHVVRSIAGLFKPVYGRYSNAMIDVVFDHFLASALSREDDEAFEIFTRTVYRHLETFTNILPVTFNNIFPYMKQHNWLYNYQFAWGIQKSITGLVHRARYLSDSESAFKIFQYRYNDFKSAYEEFFPLLRTFALEKFSDIH